MNSGFKILFLFFLNLALILPIQAEVSSKMITGYDSAAIEKPWAIATLSVSNVRGKAEHSSELVTQVLMGTPLKVLETVEGWYKVETPEHYTGWIDSFGLACFTNDEMENWKESPRYFYGMISGNVFSSTEKKASVISDLVLGDLFVSEGESKGFLRIKIPDGRIGFVRKSECISFRNWTEHKPDVKKVISVAKEMLGSPYLWGGTSTKGVDCSGFTKNAYFSQGIILERDAWQQARNGEHPDFNKIENLQPGDLLFFGPSKQKIAHVGIYIGNTYYIHASGLVRINSIDPKNSNYILTEKRQLVASSRIVNSLGTEGITLIKDHPWYVSEKTK